MRWILAPFLLAVSAVPAVAQPRVSIEQGLLHARLGRAVVEGTEIRAKLQSGLSTTFVIAARGEASPPARRLETTARVEVRYDLWDEVFIVTEYRPDRSVARARIASLEALASWWQEHPVVLGGAGGAARFTGELELRVLPFSFTEERDAQGWVSRSLGLSSNTPVTDTGAGGSPVRGGMLDAMIATSIRAKPISVRRWRVDSGGAAPR